MPTGADCIQGRARTRSVLISHAWLKTPVAAHMLDTAHLFYFKVHVYTDMAIATLEACTENESFVRVMLGCRGLLGAPVAIMEAHSRLLP